MPAVNAAANAMPPTSHRPAIRYEIRSIIVVVPLVSVGSVLQSALHAHNRIFKLFTYHAIYMIGANGVASI